MSWPLGVDTRIALTRRANLLEVGVWIPEVRVRPLSSGEFEGGNVRFRGGRDALRSNVFAGVGRGIEVNDEGLDVEGDFDWRKEEVCRGEDASGRSICGVGLGTDVLCLEDSILFVQ